MHGQDTAQGITFRLDHKPQMSVFVPTFFSNQPKQSSIYFISSPKRNTLIVEYAEFCRFSLRQSSYINITTENWLSKKFLDFLASVIIIGSLCRYFIRFPEFFFLWWKQVHIFCCLLHNLSSRKISLTFENFVHIRPVITTIPGKGLYFYTFFFYECRQQICKFIHVIILIVCFNLETIV